MRERLAAAVFLAIAGAGCSLLVSEDFASEDDPPPGSDAGGDATDGGNDAPVTPSDDGGDAAPDGPLDPSLLAYWSFDGTPASLIADDTGHGHSLVSSGAQVTPGAGKRGGALVFTGNQFAFADSLKDDAFPKSGTISAWIKYDWPTNDDLNIERGIFDNWDKSRSHLFIRRNAGSGGAFQVAAQPATTGGNYSWARGFDATRGEWAHLIVTWDSVAKAGALYVNGTQIESSPYFDDVEFQPTQQLVRIGDNFIGAIDEVRIYDRALSAAEALLLP